MIPDGAEEMTVDTADSGASSSSADPTQVVPDGADFTEWFTERFADYWQIAGASRIEGRIAGYLLLGKSSGISAEELSTALGVSRGSVSAYTRNLVAAGFVRRIRRPGARAHYFVMDADVWGGFLEKEHHYLASQRALATAALAHVDPGTAAYQRVLNMRDYMGWVIDNRSLRSEWNRFKQQRDAAGP